MRRWRDRRHAGLMYGVHHVSGPPVCGTTTPFVPLSRTRLSQPPYGFASLFLSPDLKGPLRAVHRACNHHFLERKPRNLVQSTPRNVESRYYAMLTHFGASIVPNTPEPMGLGC